MDKLEQRVKELERLVEVLFKHLDETLFEAIDLDYDEDAESMSNTNRRDKLGWEQTHGGQ